MSDHETSLNRRQLLATGAGLVAASATTGLALGHSQPDGRGQPADAGRRELPNPATQYPRPPFAAQSQRWPGLASRMQPPPDHGEKSYRGSGKLVGRRALITGGDSGIGRAAAIAFAREGADVAIGYVEPEQPDADDTKRFIEDAGCKAVLLPGDIRSEDFCRELVRRAVVELGGLDIVVNNAGYHVAVESITDVPTEQLERTFRTNVFAPFWIVQAALPHLSAGASIINTASFLAFSPGADQLDYSMTKACNVSFTKGLARQLIPRGIRVNAVAPGSFWTPFTVVSRAAEAVVNHGSGTAMGRPSQPAELAAVYVFLASTEASFVTGEVYAGVGGQMPY